MLALLAPGVGMGGGDARAGAPAETAGGHALGRRTTNWQPYLTVVLAMLLVEVAGG